MQKKKIFLIIFIIVAIILVIVSLKYMTDNTNLIRNNSTSQTKQGTSEKNDTTSLTKLESPQTSNEKKKLDNIEAQYQAILRNLTLSTAETSDQILALSDQYKEYVSVYTKFIEKSLTGEEKSKFESETKAWGNFIQANDDVDEIIVNRTFGAGTMGSIVLAQFYYHKYQDRAYELMRIYELLIGEWIGLD